MPRNTIFLPILAKAFNLSLTQFDADPAGHKSRSELDSRML
jgi:hypothetical protein